MMRVKFLQANVNRSRPSLDLLIQHAKETDVGVLLVSEPYSVPGSDNWFASRDGLAAIYCDANFTRRRCLLVKQGRNFVAVGCGDYLFISVYVSPRLGLRDFNSILDEISLVLSNRVDKLVIGGDFNAKACLWGALRTDGRGRLISIWAAERDLRVANTGNRPTCVRAQGTSIVDITWVSSDILPFVKDWRVEEELESLSDHLFIAFALSTSRSRPPPGRPSSRKWNLKKFNRDQFSAALHWSSFEPEVEDHTNIQGMIRWLDRIMQEACDTATSRIGPRKPRRQTYWWQDSVASLRHNCIQSRRRWQRAKRKRQRDQREINDLGEAYKLKRKELRTEIAKVKSQAWQELIDTINNDPWGLPYGLVIKKLKAASPSLTELLDPDVLSDLLDSLFPKNDRPDPHTNWEDFEWSDDWSVQLNEVSNVISKKTASASKAPGPDGLGLIIWKRTPGKILEWIRLIFDECFKKGVFPTVWKRANLVLIPKASKPGAPEGRLPKVRPICLLDDIGKAFERLIVNRILLWQGTNPDSCLSDNQFGFVKWRSTCDALLKLKEIALRAVKANGGFAFAISLDIRNAFNSVPWRTIRGALRHKEFPDYIRRILDSYLSNRSICFVGRDGKRHERPMEAGVPQGSVLGPFLWNIAFDSILNIEIDDDDVNNESHIICYADDTMIVVTGSDLLHTRVRACLLANRVIDAIQRLGLAVATEKTEAILFCAERASDIPNQIVVNDVGIDLSPSIKYLGVLIDPQWSFSDHFRYVEDKAGRVVRALNRLMPNLKGPDEKQRRLYANAIISVVLYGAPVWADELKRNQLLTSLNRLERSVAQRVISGYKTVSANAAFLLARMPPLRFLAPARKKMYDRVKRFKIDGDYTKGRRNEVREEELARMYKEWRTYLEKPNRPGEFTKMAIVPWLEAWMEREHGSMAFHLTQLMTHSARMPGMGQRQAQANNRPGTAERFHVGRRGGGHDFLAQPLENFLRFCGE
ncbi:reverse transcriptase, partial [Lasius niger]